MTSNSRMVQFLKGFVPKKSRSQAYASTSSRVENASEFGYVIFDVVNFPNGSIFEGIRFKKNKPRRSSFSFFF